MTVRTSIYFRAVIFRGISRSEISFKKQELLQCSGYYSHCQSHLMPRTRSNRGDSWLYEPQYQDPRRGKRCAAGFKTKQSFHCFLGSWGYLYLITEWGELVKAKTIGRLGWGLKVYGRGGEGTTVGGGEGMTVGGGEGTTVGGEEGKGRYQWVVSCKVTESSLNETEIWITYISRKVIVNPQVFHLFSLLVFFLENIAYLLLMFLICLWLNDEKECDKINKKVLS